MINLPQKFSQNDPRWKNSPLGTKGTIGLYGCLMTDATMIADYFKKLNETPLSVNAKMAANNGYQNGNLFVWGVFASLFGLKYSGQFSNSAALTAAQMNQIRAQIDKGYPVLLQIDTIPATSGLDEHWILAIGYDKQSPDDLIVQDPWDGAEKRITSWGVQPQKLIYAWCWYEGQVPATDTPPSSEMITIPVSERDFLVSRATVAKEVAQYLGIDDPDHAPTDRYKKSIDGLKSATTAAQTALADCQKKLSIAEAEVLNREEQVSRLKQQVTDTEKYYKAQIDALNKNLKGLPEALKLAEGRITEIQGQLTAASKAKGEALKEVAGLKIQLEACEKGQGAVKKTLIDQIIAFLKSLRGK